LNIELSEIFELQGYQDGAIDIIFNKSIRHGELNAGIEHRLGDHLRCP
jgi:hypothetical protein